MVFWAREVHVTKPPAREMKYPDWDLRVVLSDAQSESVTATSPSFEAPLYVRR